MSTFAIPFETRVCPERVGRKARGRELKKFSKKIWRKENKFLPLQPRKKRGTGKAGRKAPSTEKIIEKTEGKYKEASTETK